MATVEQEPIREMGDDFVSFADGIENERAERLENAKRIIPFGIKYLDVALRGIFPNDLVLVGAAAGAGKTDLITITAMGNAAAGKRVHVFALEAEKQELERRMKFKLLVKLFYANAADKSQADRLNYLDWLAGDLEDVLGPWDESANRALKSELKTLKVYYRRRNFSGDDLVRMMLAVQDQTDLIVVDHLHYVDVDDDNENRGVKAIVKQVRDSALDIGKPVILVAHIRKGDRRLPQLVPTLEDFHGTSDIPKIATKAIMIAPADDIDSGASHLWPTYFKVQKCRPDGQRSKYLASMTFNARKGKYEPEYMLGKAVGGKFEAVPANKLPAWAKGAS
jgi:hypothetical protein